MSGGATLHTRSAWVAAAAILAGCAMPASVVPPDTGPPPQRLPAPAGEGPTLPSAPEARRLAPIYGLEQLAVGIGLEEYLDAYVNDYESAFERAVLLYKESSARDWRHDVAPLAWSNVAVDYIHDKIGNPPAQTRAHALTHLAILKALIAARGGLKGPHGCTLKEEAAIATAVTTVLATLYPAGADELSELGSRRVLEKARNKKQLKEVAAGQVIGLQVASAINDLAATDHGPPPAEPYPYIEGRFYDPDPIGYDVPTWKCYVANLASDDYDLPPVPQPGEPGFEEQAFAVTNAQAHLTEGKKRNAMFWASVLPPNDMIRILALQLSQRDFSAADAAQALAWNTLAQLDAFIAAWTVKYDQKLVRPDVGLPGFVPWLATDDARRVFDELALAPIDTPYVLFGTPNFPAYPSGHSTQSAAAAMHAGWLLPDQREFWDSMALASGMSRIDGGIHWPADHLGGRALGRAIAKTVIAHQRATRGIYQGRPYGE